MQNGRTGEATVSKKNALAEALLRAGRYRFQGNASKNLVEPERFSRENIEDFMKHSYELVRTKLTKRMQAALVAKEKK